MDAKKVFQTILRNIESCGLNYSLSKTPFSASISLKCSFIQRFQEVSQDNNICKDENFSRKSIQHDALVQKLEAENLQLRAELDTFKDLQLQDSDQKKMMEELVKLQNVYDHEKKEFKALVKTVAEFRDELLKVKKEKHLLSGNLKIKEEECETFKTKLYALNGKNVAMEKVVNHISESVELRDAELANTKRDYESVYETLRKTQSELENLKLERVTELQVYKCESCDFTAETYAKLKIHNRQNHCRSKLTQCEKDSIFLKYNCFYCEEPFNSADDIAAHPSDCHFQFDIIL